MVWERNEVIKQENRLDSDESRRFLVERAMGIEQLLSFRSMIKTIRFGRKCIKKSLFSCPCMVGLFAI